MTSDRRAIGVLAIAARQRRAAHLASLRAVAIREGDVVRTMQALAEAEAALSAARIVAGLDRAAD